MWRWASPVTAWSTKIGVSLPIQAQKVDYRFNIFRGTASISADFYLVMFIDTFLKSSEQFWSVTVSTTEARHNHGALQSCNWSVTAHCDLAPVQSVVRASRRTWIRGCQYSVQITNVKFCVSVPRSLNRPVLLVQWVQSIRIQLNPSVGKCTVWVKRHQLNCPSQLLRTKKDDQNRIRRGLRNGHVRVVGAS